jgi:hypothetical protein
MPSPRDIDSLLRTWEFRPGEVNARLFKNRSGREVLQMRIDMGVVQMETDLRPDGQRPNGAETYYDYLVGEVIREGDAFRLTKEQCAEADREFAQYYQRRLCWLSLREYRRAAHDADHSLAFMDFVREHSPDEEWTLTHEQYRPFVLFHRVQAAALASLEEQGPEAAISELNAGLTTFRDLFARYDASEQFENDELVKRLSEMRESVRQRYEIGRTLPEQLDDAVKAEDYELAAKIRDRIRNGEKVSADGTGDGADAVEH